MESLIRRFIGEEEGQDLVEYAFLTAFIALAFILVLVTLQGSIQTLFEETGSAVAGS